MFTFYKFNYRINYKLTFNYFLNYMFLFELIHECSPKVNVDTMSSLIQTESSTNPYAIAEILPNKNVISHNPKNKLSAIEIIKDIERKQHNYSVGIAQINKVNFKRFNVSGIDLLDPCTNVRISQHILQECYVRYKDTNDMLSCYYSGNNRSGYIKEGRSGSYVERVHNNLIKVSNKNIYEVEIPSIKGKKYIDGNKKIKKNNLKKSNKGSQSYFMNIKYVSKLNK
ncbi:MAG: transglycosylase SLT domain-containing protein [Neisseriaceae bacterium]|nr:MAG: transglycosylase SLT domain-containing protein [Neisseriaceae bacterium]